MARPPSLMGRVLTCQKCRALLEPGTKTCPYCGTDQRHQLAPSDAQDTASATRFGLWILGVIVAVFLMMLLLDPAKDDRTRAFEPSPAAFVMFGWARWDLVHECRQYWRLLASMFLHGGLVHLLMNGIALFYLAPIAARTFGANRTACIYFGAGIAGGVLSHAMGNSGLGASGAILGLIGASAAYGWRRGGLAGRALTRGMVSWALLIFVFGVVMPGIDNAGHVGGFLGGGLLGYLGAAVRARGGFVDRLWGLLARAAVVATLVVAAFFWVPSLRRGLERRDAELYDARVRRTLVRIAEWVSGASRGRPLPDAFQEGPRGSDEVRDAVRAALAAARQDPSAAAGKLARARRAYAEWRAGLLCRYGLEARDLD